jgi:hypothetical protein
LALTRLRESSSAEIKLPLGGTSNRKLHTAVLDALEQGPKAMSELAALPEFAETGLAGVAEVAAVMITAAQAAPYLVHPSSVDPRSAQRLNRAIAEHVIDYNYLASPLLGSGIQVGQLGRLLYRVLSRHEEGITAQALSAEVWQIMEERGDTCSEDEQSANPGKINRSRMAVVADKALAYCLPEWRRLGML